MSVWFCIPSCRSAVEAEACLAKWRALGYKIALLRQGEPIECDLLIPTGEYLGWPQSTNILAKEVLRSDASASWLVGGGDDYWPDPTQEAEQIAQVCEFHFYNSMECTYPPDKPQWALDRFYELAQISGGSGRDAPSFKAWSTFGVMQPTGDRWGDTASTRKTFGQDRGAEIDRICGSPWLGREWCERAYQGKGPMFAGYHHLYADEELHDVAEKLGVLWQRRDLTQYHNHPCRERGYGAYNEGHLKPLYSSEAWEREGALFRERKAAGFPESEPLCSI